MYISKVLGFGYPYKIIWDRERAGGDLFDFLACVCERFGIMFEYM